MSLPSPDQPTPPEISAPATGSGGSPPSPGVQQAATDAGKALVAPRGPKTPAPPLKKLVVAIHGIGDQYQNATVQSVVTRFADYFNFPTAAPLGNFQFQKGELAAFRFISNPPAPTELAEIGFLEVYWANIPRGIQKEGFTIEESKAWARTIVRRLEARYGSEFKKGLEWTVDDCREAADLANNRATLEAAKTRGIEEVKKRIDDLKAKAAPELSKPLGLGPHDFKLAADVLEEMIETLKVLGNLTYLAEKAGLMKFDLDDLLTNYLGDVQIVAEFGKYREDILKQFHAVIENVWGSVGAQDGLPEIYIVAHSEGTVISFMGLLEAMTSTKRPPWIDHVRGFMTFGSPIDKHIVLWPEIWTRFHTAGQGPKAGQKEDPAPIQWRNYYDYGDPIGFKLDTVRDWLEDHKWDKTKAFDFTNDDDFGFSRYVLPGAAHNEYWGDKAVFGNFIQTVMGLKSPAGENYASRPSNSRNAAVASYVIPYFIAFGLVYGATYILLKAVADYLFLQNLPLKTLVGNTLAISSLIVGVSLAVRIPRLTRSPGWKLGATALFVFFATAFALLLSGGLGDKLSLACVPGWASMLLVALVVVVTVRVFTRSKNLWPGIAALFRGARPLILTGALAVGAIVGFQIYDHWSNPGEVAGSGEVWPLILAGAGFLYLWWLAVLLFDLVFVWHRYIRNSSLQERMRVFRRSRKLREGEP